MSKQSITSTSLDHELVALAQYSIHDLRGRWRALFCRDVPPAFGPDLLRRSIAQKLQEDAYGRLSPITQRELNRLVATLAKSPDGRLELQRRINPGAVLVREWKGTTCRVTIIDDGFSYQGRSYASLSEIAREITGTRWNGPRFFGLRLTDKSKNDVDQAKLKRGRPARAGASKLSPPKDAGHAR